MRLLFSKTETAKYMSHLDLMRCMTRMMERARIPIWYTQGFNPHPYLVFSPPLPLGIASNCELLDIKLTKEESFDRMKNELNRVAPKGIVIHKIYEPTTSFNDIAFAKYNIRFEQKFAADFAHFFENDICIEKKTKRGMKTVNLKEEISDLEIVFEDGFESVTLCLPCGNEKNIGINLFADAFSSFVSDEIYFITERLAFLDENKKIIDMK
ncbi:MAG: DUF2344 domain-containing protein [Ruminococcaceae bacterium]|nr:DUF2344 domain-containing protein [Oscillospiraceae bacterium]